MADETNKTPQAAQKAPTAPTPHTNVVPQNDPNAAQRTADAQRTLEQNRSDAVKKLDEDEKRRVDQINQVGERESQSKPTPTQRENDLAKLGLLDIDSKEDDGSGPDVPPQNTRRTVEGQYNTRDMNKK